MNLHPTKILLGILTPFVTAGSAWLVAAGAKYGIHLDPTGVNLLGTAGAAAGAAAMVKLIHDVETSPKVKKLEAEVKHEVAPVVAAVEAADPAAKQEAQGVLTATEQAVVAEYRKLVGRIPQPVMSTTASVPSVTANVPVTLTQVPAAPSPASASATPPPPPAPVGPVQP